MLDCGELIRAYLNLHWTHNNQENDFMTNSELLSECYKATVSFGLAMENENLVAAFRAGNREEVARILNEEF